VLLSRQQREANSIGMYRWVRVFGGKKCHRGSKCTKKTVIGSTRRAVVVVCNWIGQTDAKLSGQSSLKKRGGTICHRGGEIQKKNSKLWGCGGGGGGGVVGGVGGGGGGGGGGVPVWCRGVGWWIRRRKELPAVMGEKKRHPGVSWAVVHGKGLGG